MSQNNPSSFRYHGRYFCHHDEKGNNYNFSGYELILLLCDSFLYFFVRRSWWLMKSQLKCYLCQSHPSPRSTLRVCLIIYLPLSSHIFFLASLPTDIEKRSDVILSFKRPFPNTCTVFSLLFIYMCAHILLFLNNK